MSKRIGHKFSEETKRKIGLANKGENNAFWKGDKVSINVLHGWIRKWKPEPKFCQMCGKVGVKLALSNVDHKYRRCLDDYTYLCYFCHAQYDKEKGFRFCNYSDKFRKKMSMVSFERERKKKELKLKDLKSVKELV